MEESSTRKLVRISIAGDASETPEESATDPSRDGPESGPNPPDRKPAAGYHGVCDSAESVSRRCSYSALPQTADAPAGQVAPARECSVTLSNERAALAAPDDGGVRQAINTSRILVTLLLVVTACGVMLERFEGYPLWSSIYGLVQILTTVGYGDVLPKTDTAKLFTAILVLACTTLNAVIVSSMLDRLMDLQTAQLTKVIKAREALIQQNQESQPATTNWVPKELAINGLILFGCIAAGTVFYSVFESCTCGSGPTFIEDCEPEHCQATGGVQKTWIDALYMSVSTLTTVGFGDVKPETTPGRIFAIFWMIFGIASMANFVGDFTAFFFQEGANRTNRRITEELFNTMDQDGSGTLDRTEFLRLQCIINGLASAEVLDSMMSQFHLLDHSKDGHVSISELRKFYSH